MLSLAANNEQTTAVALLPDERGAWQTSFTLTDAIAGHPLLAEVRTLPAGTLTMVQVGDVPRLLEQLESGINDAWWEEETGQLVFTASLTHTGEGEVYLGSDFIQLPERSETTPKGGDVYEFSGQVAPSLPLFIHPGETVGITVTFLPQAPSVRVQIGSDLWEITDIPPFP
jgi:hypothetical protein